MHMAERGTGEPWPLYFKLLCIMAVLLSFVGVIIGVFDRPSNNITKEKINYERSI